MKKLLVLILSAILPFLLVLGFGRKSVDSQQKFLPSANDVLIMVQTCPDFTKSLSEDISAVSSFWLQTQEVFFQKPDGQDYSEIWSDANDDNFFVKLGNTFKFLFGQISNFFACFVPFFQMIGASFTLVGHALYIPIEFISWLWNNLLGFSKT